MLRELAEVRLVSPDLLREVAPKLLIAHGVVAA